MLYEKQPVVLHEVSTSRQKFLMEADAVCCMPCIAVLLYFFRLALGYDIVQECFWHAAVRWHLFVSGLYEADFHMCCAARSAAGQQEHGEGHEHRPQSASQGHAGLPPTHAAAAVYKIISAALTRIFPWSFSRLCILFPLPEEEQGLGSACRWRLACMASRWQASFPFHRQGTSPPCSGAAPSSCRRCAALVPLRDGHAVAASPTLGRYVGPCPCSPAARGWLRAVSHAGLQRHL